MVLLMALCPAPSAGLSECLSSPMEGPTARIILWGGGSSLKVVALSPHENVDQESGHPGLHDTLGSGTAPCVLGPQLWVPGS